jgi:hyperosmotically inducible periplasmic protein
MNHSKMSRTLQNTCGMLVMASALLCANQAFGQDQSAAPQTTQPDNSAMNKHHKVTAGQQTDAASDRALTAQIRKSIIANKDLSLYGHNVKIITINGMVTLKGPVKSNEEKQTIADLAAKASGSSNKVTNSLTVKQ